MLCKVVRIFLIVCKFVCEFRWIFFNINLHENKILTSNSLILNIKVSLCTSISFILAEPVRLPPFLKDQLGVLNETILCCTKDESKNNGDRIQSYRN